ncbi:hypothetical protein [Dongia sp.]|uniref:hypothetical protein n=1 Tax=Dongia sp. TaxID=1977262 RepID=UPI0035AEA397
MHLAELGLIAGGLLVTFLLAQPAAAEDAKAVADLEQAAVNGLLAGEYGAADEKIRAAIAIADNDSFNRLALLQGLIAQRMGGDGRSLMGAAIAAHESNAWPRPVIAYLLGARKLQDVADEIRRSGNMFEVKRQQICELSFYAGTFAAADDERKFAQRLIDKAVQACDPGTPLATLAQAEDTALKTQP